MFSSCEQNISVDLGDYEPKISVFSVLQPDSAPEVYVTESIQYFAFENDDQEFRYLKDAQVELSDGVQTEVLQLSIKNFTPDHPQIPGDSIQPISVFYFSGNMKIEVGKTYTLRVSDKGRVATATTTVPVPPQIEEGYFERRVVEEFASIDTNYILGVYIQEQPGNNFYRMAYGHFVTLYLEEDTIVESRAPVSRNFSDKTQRRDGRIYVEHTINYLRWNQEYLIGPHPITIRVDNVHRDYKEFYESLREQRSSQGNPFTEPVQVRSNISGGIGLFSSYSSSAPFIYELHL